MENNNLKNFYGNTWSKNDSNTGKSFTAGSCLYDYAKGRNSTGIDELDTELTDAAINEYGITQNADQITAAAALELLDIAIIDEIASPYIFGNDDENDDE